MSHNFEFNKSFTFGTILAPKSRIHLGNSISRSLLVVLTLLCAFPRLSSGQVGGKWERIEHYSNKTGDKLTGVSVTSLSTVPEGKAELRAMLVVTGGDQPTITIDFGGQWIYLEYKSMKSESWLDDSKDTPLNVRWMPEQDMCNRKPCIRLISLSDDLLSHIFKAKIFHISFWANDSQRYVHTFPVAGLADHAKFLGITAPQRVKKRK